MPLTDSQMDVLARVGEAADARRRIWKRDRVSGNRRPFRRVLTAAQVRAAVALQDDGLIQVGTMPASHAPTWQLTFEGRVTLAGLIAAGKVAKPVWPSEGEDAPDERSVCEPSGARATVDAAAWLLRCTTPVLSAVSPVSNVSEEAAQELKRWLRHDGAWGRGAVVGIFSGPLPHASDRLGLIVVTDGDLAIDVPETIRGVDVEVISLTGAVPAEVRRPCYIGDLLGSAQSLAQTCCGVAEMLEMAKPTDEGVLTAAIERLQAAAEAHAVDRKVNHDQGKPEVGKIFWGLPAGRTASGAPEVHELSPGGYRSRLGQRTGAETCYSWGTKDAATRQLAHDLLRATLGYDPDPLLVSGFRNDVLVARPSNKAFWLSQTDIAKWVERFRELVAVD